MDAKEDGKKRAQAVMHAADATGNAAEEWQNSFVGGSSSISSQRRRLRPRQNDQPATDKERPRQGGKDVIQYNAVKWVDDPEPLFAAVTAVAATAAAAARGSIHWVLAAWTWVFALVVVMMTTSTPTATEAVVASRSPTSRTLSGDHHHRTVPGAKLRADADEAETAVGKGLNAAVSGVSWCGEETKRKKSIHCYPWLRECRITTKMAAADAGAGALLCVAVAAAAAGADDVGAFVGILAGAATAWASYAFRWHGSVAVPAGAALALGLGVSVSLAFMWPEKMPSPLSPTGVPASSGSGGSGGGSEGSDGSGRVMAQAYGGTEAKRKSIGNNADTTTDPLPLPSAAQAQASSAAADGQIARAVVHVFPPGDSMNTTGGVTGGDSVGGTGGKGKRSKKKKGGGRHSHEGALRKGGTTAGGAVAASSGEADLESLSLSLHHLAAAISAQRRADAYHCNGSAGAAGSGGRGGGNMQEAAAAGNGAMPRSPANGGEVRRRLELKAARVAVEAASLLCEGRGVAEDPTSAYSILRAGAAALGTTGEVPVERMIGSQLLAIKGDICYRLASRGGGGNAVVDVAGDYHLDGGGCSRLGKGDSADAPPGARAVASGVQLIAALGDQGSGASSSDGIGDDGRKGGKDKAGDMGELKQAGDGQAEGNSDDGKLKRAFSAVDLSRGRGEIRRSREELYQDAIQAYYQALSLSPPGPGRAAVQRPLGSVYNDLAAMRLAERRFTRALESYRQGIFLFREAGDRVNEALLLCNIGRAMLMRARWEGGEGDVNGLAAVQPSSPSSTSSSLPAAPSRGQVLGGGSCSPWASGWSGGFQASTSAAAPIDECASFSIAFENLSKAVQVLGDAKPSHTPPNATQGGCSARAGRHQHQTPWHRGTEDTMTSTKKKAVKREVSAMARDVRVNLGRAHFMFAVRVMHYELSDAWRKGAPAVGAAVARVDNIALDARESDGSSGLGCEATPQDALTWSVHRHLRRAAALFAEGGDGASAAVAHYFLGLASLRRLSAVNCGWGEAAPGVALPSAGDANEFAWHERTASDAVAKAAALFAQLSLADSLRVTLLRASVRRARALALIANERGGGAAVLVEAMSSLLKGSRQAAKRASREESAGSSSGGGAQLGLHDEGVVASTLRNVAGAAEEDSIDGVWSVVHRAVLALFKDLIKGLEADDRLRTSVPDAKAVFLKALRVDKGVSVADHLVHADALWAEVAP